MALKQQQEFVTCRMKNKRELPVIALTADAMKGVREELISKGMSGFLTKPIVIGDLYKMLRKWLPEEKNLLIIKVFIRKYFNFPYGAYLTGTSNLLLL